MPPARAVDAAPPLASRHAQMRVPGLFRRGEMPRENKSATQTLRLGPVAGGLHEFGKLPVRYAGRIHMESVELEQMNWGLRLTAHEKFTAANQAHAIPRNVPGWRRGHD